MNYDLWFMNNAFLKNVNIKFKEQLLPVLVVSLYIIKKIDFVLNVSTLCTVITFL